MTGLEDKISGLSQSQRKEVEDFVDFLLAHHAVPTPTPTSGFLASPPESGKPIILADEIPVRGESNILPGYHDLEDDMGENKEQKKTGSRARPHLVKEPDQASRILDWID